MSLFQEGEKRRIEEAIPIFFAAVRQKLMYQVEQGYEGWDDPVYFKVMKTQLARLIDKVEHGDENQYLDIAALAMFLWYQMKMQGDRDETERR